jgi:hypothetical protein
MSCDWNLVGRCGFQLLSNNDFNEASAETMNLLWKFHMVRIYTRHLFFAKCRQALQELESFKLSASLSRTDSPVLLWCFQQDDRRAAGNKPRHLAKGGGMIIQSIT